MAAGINSAMQPRRRLSEVFQHPIHSGASRICAPASHCVPQRCLGHRRRERRRRVVALDGQRASAGTGAAMVPASATASFRDGALLCCFGVAAAAGWDGRGAGAGAAAGSVQSSPLAVLDLEEVGDCAHSKLGMHSSASLRSACLPLPPGQHFLGCKNSLSASTAKPHPQLLLLLQPPQVLSGQSGPLPVMAAVITRVYHLAATAVAVLTPLRISLTHPSCPAVRAPATVCPTSAVSGTAGASEDGEWSCWMGSAPQSAPAL